MNRKKLFAQTAVLIILVLLCIVMLPSCKKPETEEDILSVEVLKGCLKNVYKIDEKLDLNNVYIVITLSTGTRTEKVSSASMVEGFDTSTVTETFELRYMRIKYKGKYTTEWGYSVINDNAVNTEARLNASASTTANGIWLRLSLNKGDLSGIYAIMFTVKFDENALTYKPDSFVGHINKWEKELSPIRNSQFTVLYYALPDADPIGSSMVIINMEFIGAGAAGSIVEIKSISVSDRRSEYYLPDTTSANEA